MVMPTIAAALMAKLTILNKFVISDYPSPSFKRSDHN